MRVDYDVVIAGFGPTGAMAANMLGHHNIPRWWSTQHLRFLTFRGVYILTAKQCGFSNHRHCR